MSQHVKIDVQDWRKIPADKKEDLWNLVKEKFSFVPAESEAIKKWVICNMGLKWKSWKYELKRKLYDPSLTVDEILGAQTDSRVDKVQFKNLVTLWFSEEAQVESEKNKRIRSKSNEPHVMGTKSFARLIHEETKKKSVRPSRAMVYRMSRTRKDGSIVNGRTAEIMDKLQAISDASVVTMMVVLRKEMEGLWIGKNDALAKVKGQKKEEEFAV